jgi:hypothetical protein
VPVAFTGRTSTLTLQDPAASLRRQVRECQAKLPPGWYIAAWFWDIESGGLPTDQRGHGSGHEQFADIGIPRDGGLADLLAEAASPAPRFAAVICEDIERSGRDTYYALQLEKQLTLAGIPLFARHTAPDGHPRTISVREDHLLPAIHQFFAQRVFGSDRAILLAADLPASAADDAARRDRQAAALTKRLRQIDAAENAHAREIESLAHLDDPHAPAVTALRSRVLARFTELEDERTQINTQLAGLAKTSTGPGDPALLDALPLLGDWLAEAPVRLQQQLYDAFDLQALYKKNMHQVTIHVTITDSTPAPSPPSSTTPAATPGTSP